MKYVLDTNVVSSLMRRDPVVVARLERVDRNELAIPEPVFGEIAYGIARLPASKRKRQLTEDLARIGDAIDAVGWTRDVSEQFGLIKAALERRGRRLEDSDIAIAAHAVAGDAILVTANVEQMTRISLIADLVVENWER